MSALSAAAIRTLASTIDGTVAHRDDPSFDGALRDVLWNRLALARRPELIVRVTADSSVAPALAFAREHRLRVAVRSGGHSWCGAPLREGSLLLDLGELDAVTLDLDSRTATVQPAVTNRALARVLGGQGLAFPYGHCSSVGLGGYVLAGGFGWNTRAWGLACDNLRALDVVLADGRCMTASADEHADLLWAARGAGPGFCAIATRYQLNLHPLPGSITSSRHVFPLAAARAVASWLESIAAELPAEVELTLFLAAAPDGSGHRCMVAATAFSATPAAAAHALRFMASCPVIERAIERALLVPTSLDALFGGVDTMFPAEHRYAADTAWITSPLPDLIDVLGERLVRSPSARSFFLCAIAPAPATVRADAAISPGAGVLLNSSAVWRTADDAANLAWHADTMAALAPLSAGHYVGEADIAAIPARAAGSFSAASWQRLAAVRERYDPEHLLHGWFDEDVAVLKPGPTNVR